MTDTSFNALVLRKDDEGKTQSAIEQVSMADLPSDEVLIKVDYSSLNYRMALPLLAKAPSCANSR